MSTKKEEKAAFERLKREFPELDVSLTCEYATYREVVPCYYVTICGGLEGDYSGIGKQTLDADEAVNYIIEEVAKVEEEEEDEEEDEEAEKEGREYSEVFCEKKARMEKAEA